MGASRRDLRRGHAEHLYEIHAFRSDKLLTVNSLVDRKNPVVITLAALLTSIVDPDGVSSMEVEFYVPNEEHHLRSIVKYYQEATAPGPGISITRNAFTWPIEDELSEEKIEALAAMICQAGDESAAALLVLMGMLENSTHPKVLANVAKHSAFTRCGESNLYGMVDAQIAIVEGELLRKPSRPSSDCLSRRFPD